MIKFTPASKKDCVAASNTLAASGKALFWEGDPVKIAAKQAKRKGALSRSRRR